MVAVSSSLKAGEGGENIAACPLRLLRLRFWEWPLSGINMASVSPLLFGTGFQATTNLPFLEGTIQSPAIQGQGGLKSIIIRLLLLWPSAALCLGPSFSLARYMLSTDRIDEGIDAKMLLKPHVSRIRNSVVSMKQTLSQSMWKCVSVMSYSCQCGCDMIWCARCQWIGVTQVCQGRAVGVRVWCQWKNQVSFANCKMLLPNDLALVLLHCFLRPTSIWINFHDDQATIRIPTDDESVLINTWLKWNIYSLNST